MERKTVTQDTVNFDCCLAASLEPKMVLLGSQRPPPSSFILSSFISFVFVLLTQLTLAMVPRYFSSLPFLAMLALSALFLLAVTGFGSCCRRLVRVYASAPAFVVFNALFIWGVYIVVIREAIPSFSDVVFNAELSLLMIGYCRILCGDPGLVTHESSGLDKISGNIDSEVKLDSEDDELSLSHVCLEQHSKEAEEGYPEVRRVRYCKHCKAYIWGFDHHCPAFGNCIGQKNYALFMALLLGFIIAESSFVALSTQFITESGSMDETVLESNPASNLATSTMLFCINQILWQAVFFLWHIYCICFNIKTDEWINWKEYPEFQLTVQCQEGHNSFETKFRNPYDKGILSNLGEFLAATRAHFGHVLKIQMLGYIQIICLQKTKTRKREMWLGEGDVSEPLALSGYLYHDLEAVDDPDYLPGYTKWNNRKEAFRRLD
ncbi:hypothetical protein NE237_004181 [Protea cynaroides]|uniref:S-acyltransferase n=1 Tax=Protea cynaroides TaxID=273540 RepID=A0A9Q0QTC5_9MAGN|nr:hypothetical protein NE237_004181 [Protea cynaroides]